MCMCMHVAAHACAYGGQCGCVPVLEAREASVRLEAGLEHLDWVDAAPSERAAGEAREQPLGRAGRSVGCSEPHSGSDNVHLLGDGVEQPYPHGVEGDLARDPERETALQAAHAMGVEVLPHAVDPAAVHTRLSSEASLVVELQTHLGELEWMGEAHGDAARERWHAHLLQHAVPRRPGLRHPCQHSAGVEAPEAQLRSCKRAEGNEVHFVRRSTIIRARTKCRCNTFVTLSNVINWQKARVSHTKCCSCDTVTKYPAVHRARLRLN